ncbi:MAG: 4-hydroxy-3-methylbut-2-enyl diphosphate reductase [Candidatus Omnitrophota bacterium]
MATPENEAAYYKRGFNLKDEIKGELVGDYHSPLIEKLKAERYTYRAGDLTIRLAQEFGFCYGVDQAVAYAYETRLKFPDRKIYLTSEIIHNPRVNHYLKEMGISFLSGGRYEGVRPEDVVLIPAFGVPVADLEMLKAKRCILVDTTCGSVVQVWRRVEQYAKDGFTAIVHGKFDHEETRATCSRAASFPGGKFLVLSDLSEAEEVCAYILKGASKARFLEKFGRVASPGFDPDRDLEKVGCANQTTMLSSESLAVAKRFGETMAQKYGLEALALHFRSFDTICSATQERQEAVLRLLEEGVDLVIVVGGFNSSNTSHLHEIAASKISAYHIEDASCILSREAIRHKSVGKKEITVKRGWAKTGPLAIGVTSGASTPDRVTGEVIARLVEVLAGKHPETRT